MAQAYHCSPLEIRKKWTRKLFMDAVESLHVQAEIEGRKADAME
ncbi:MAG: hypothetical protein ACRCVE_02030 [Plesiomonas sp.]